MTYASDLAAVRAAVARIAGIAHRTPVLTSETVDRLAGRRVYFKCENFQKSGSFKYRGATNAVQKLDAETAKRGVVTPHTAAKVKKQAVIGYGGHVVECEPNLADRERTANELVAKTGGTLIPPFDHADVIAGQGTVALEFLDEVPTLDTLVVPVGGGGMLSGVCLASKGIRETIRVYGAEPLNADDAARSKAGGVWVPQTAPNTIADGLMTSLGQLTWPIVRDRVDGIFTVTEDQIRSAMRLVWERMKIVIEPSSAVVVAVVLSDEFKAKEPGANVGIVISGGNVSLDKLYW